MPPLGRLALLLAASAATTSARMCSLWQIIDEKQSEFNDVSGVLNDKYGLTLKGAWAPAIAGKMLQTFDSVCPQSLSELEGIGFTLSTSPSEPLQLSYSEVKAGPATIGVSNLRALLEPAHFTATSAQCVGPNEGGQWCFQGTVTMRAVSGVAHVLGNNFDLSEQTGVFRVWGALDPDQSELRLNLAHIEADFNVDKPQVHGPFKLTGFLLSGAALPYEFNFNALRAEATPSPAGRVAARGGLPSRRSGAPMAILGLTVVGAAVLALFANRSRARAAGTQRRDEAAPPTQPAARWTEIEGQARSEAEQVSRML